MPEEGRLEPEVAMSAESPEASLERLLGSSDEKALKDLDRFQPEMRRARRPFTELRRPPIAAQSDS